MQKLNIIQKILSFAIIVLISVYWIVTFYFVAPENYLNVHSYKANQYFNLFLFQRWGFFAPPPTFNERLYYIFYNKDGKPLETFEVLKQINTLKKQKYPFNKEEEIIDYILSNSMNSIADYSRETRNLIRYENSKNGIKDSDTSESKILVSEIENKAEFKTLRNYGKILAKFRNLNNGLNYFQVKITRIFLPQFEDRNTLAKEEVLFISTPQNLK